MPEIIFTQFNAVFPYLRSYMSSYFHMRFIASFNQIMAFIVPALVTLLQLKYQDQGNPFSSHPKTMRFSIVAYLIYYVAICLHLQSSLRRFPPDFVVLAKHCAVVFGNLSVASLASLFFVDSVRPFVYAFFVVMSSSEVLHRVWKRIMETKLHIICNSTGFIERVWRNLDHLFLQRNQLLPR